MEYQGFPVRGGKKVYNDYQDFLDQIDSNRSYRLAAEVYRVITEDYSRIYYRYEKFYLMNLGNYFLVFTFSGFPIGTIANAQV
jgi:hypothetical protein